MTKHPPTITLAIQIEHVQLDNAPCQLVKTYGTLSDNMALPISLDHGIIRVNRLLKLIDKVHPRGKTACHFTNIHPIEPEGFSEYSDLKQILGLRRDMP